jgi:hypothetical protein
MIIGMRPHDRVSADVAPGADASTAAPRQQPISLPALRLHALGLLASFEAGRPGYVSDRDLARFGGEPAAPVLELCVAGVWARVDGGYQIVSSEALRMAHEVHRQVRQSRTQDR